MRCSTGLNVLMVGGCRHGPGVEVCMFLPDAHAAVKVYDFIFVELFSFRCSMEDSRLTLREIKV